MDESILGQLLRVTAAGPVSGEQARAALERGKEKLAAGERDAAAVALREAAMVPATQLAAHNLIEAENLPGAFSHWMGLDATIDPGDDVYGFFAGFGAWSSPMRDYLADGWRTLSELMLLLEQAGRPLVGFANVLEFASGHGRFTRHLARAIGAQRVTVSDVVAGAVDFARAHFGVHGFDSARQPQDVHWPQQYDLVFVLSLFSHLPRATWKPWLARLWEAVAPGGVLVFSTHGAEAVRRAGVALDAAGYFFAPSSESNAIDAQEYGTAFTSEDFVRAALAECAPGAEANCTPAWFWAHQDAFVVHKTVAGGGA